MTNIKLNEKNNDFLNEATSQFLENVMEHFANERVIDDVEWQVVYDLKANLLESLECLGFNIQE